MCPTIRPMATNAGPSREASDKAENVNVIHSRFLAESSRHTKWQENPKMLGNGGLDRTEDDCDFDALRAGQGS